MTLDKTARSRDLFDLAYTAMRAMQLDEANRLLREAIKQNPDDAAARLLDAQVQLKRNLPEFGLASLETHDQLDPDNRHHPDVARLRAETLIAAGFDDMALDVLIKLVEQNPEDEHAHRMLAGLYLKREQSKPAAIHLRYVNRLAPSDETTARLLASMLEETDPASAVELAMSLETATDDAAMKLRTARMCRKTDRWRDAAKLYGELLKLRPDDAPLWIEAGQFADELGETDVAQARLEHAATCHRTHRAAALDALAISHMHCGRFAAAAVTWWRVTKQQSNAPRAWAGLWISAQCAGRSCLMTRARHQLTGQSTASERCAIIAELWPHAATARAYHSVAHRCELVDDVSSPLHELLRDATRTFTRAAVKYPMRADVHFHHAVCEQALDHEHAATLAVQEALTINPNYIAAQHLLTTLEPADDERLAA